MSLMILIIKKTRVHCIPQCVRTHHKRIKTDTWNPVIIFLVSQKLVTESLKDWDQQAYKEKRDDLYTWKELKQLLEFKFRTLELAWLQSLHSRKTGLNPKNHFTCQLRITIAKQFNWDMHILIHNLHVAFARLIIICIFNCKEFVQHSVQERRINAKKIVNAIIALSRTIMYSHVNRG